ncbi:MAG: CHASE2 domain-containing protein [Rhodospirillales bacterium]
MGEPAAEDGEAAAAHNGQSWALRGLRILVYASVSLILLNVGFDPFGLKRSAGETSESLIFNVLAAVYGEPPMVSDGPRVRWNERMTVLLFEDGALDKLKEPWPVSLATHADILRDIYDNYRPDAIMVDFLFIDRRPNDTEGLAALSSLLARIKAEGKTRVYLSAFDAPPHTAEVLEELREVTTLVAAAWHEPGGRGANPLYYPMADGGGRRPSVPRSDDAGDPGPAFVIYKDLCRHAHDGPRRLMHCPPEGAFEEALADPMKVYWGVRAPSLNWEQGNLGPRFACKAVSGGLLTRMWSLTADGLMGWKDEFPQRCPYTQMTLVREFADPDFRVYPDVLTAYDAAFGGRGDGLPTVVFYGAELAGMKDELPTHTHGTVAGIYLHAMALDNLLTLGAKYIRFSDTGGQRLVLDIVMVLAVAAASVLVTDWRRYILSDAQSHRRISAILRSRAGGPLLLAVNTAAVMPIVMAGIYVAFVELRLPPINWVAYFGVAGTVRLVEARRVEQAAMRIRDRLRARRHDKRGT